MSTTLSAPLDATELPPTSTKPTPILDRVLAILTEMPSPEGAFGTPIERGEMAVIPVTSTKGRPLATIILAPQRVEIQPIIDVTRIAFAGLAAAVAMTLFISFALRRPLSQQSRG
jgi:hypothetical protein